MTDPAEDRALRPRLPLGIVITSVVIALIAGSALVYVLYKETKGPGEILREFARRVDRHDCEGTYELIDADVQATIAEDQWCEGFLVTLDEQLDADFTLERAVLEGDIADVEVSGVSLTHWTLARFGERSWRILGAPKGFPVEANLQDSDGNVSEVTPDA